MQKFNRIAIIPAREGSKRIKNKNLINFFGKPIIFYTIKNAKKSKLFSKIHVSTNSDKIFEYLRKINLIPEFKRPNNLSGDKIGLMKVLKYVINKYEEKNVFFKEIWLLYACSPLISQDDLIKASKKFNKSKKKFPMISIKEYETPIEWALRKRGEKFGVLKPKSLKKRSQDLKLNFHETASFVIFKREHLKKESFKNYYGYKLKKYVIDIDTNEDLEIAKALYAYQKKNLMKV